MERSLIAIDSYLVADLINQPFRLLNVNPSSNAAQISDAYALALARMTTPQEALASACDAILDIGQRLPHELAYPIDCTMEQADSLYDRPSIEQPPATLLHFAAGLPPLSRANFLAHVGADRPLGGSELAALVEAHATVDPNAVYDTLKRLRRRAGLSPPSLADIGDELRRLFSRHAATVLGRYETPQQAGAASYECALTVLADGARHRVDALSAFLEPYRRSTDAERSAASSTVGHTCVAVRDNPENAKAIDNLTQALTTWCALSEPLMALNVHRSQHDQDTEAVLDHMRALLADLSSNHHFPAARHVVDLACANFRSFPTYVSQFEKAGKLLQRLASETELNKLEEATSRALNDPDFVNAAEQASFGPESEQPALDLWQAFARAVAATKASAYADRPWASIHDFVLQLIDRPDRARAALYILSGIIRHAEDEAADPAFTEIFRAELRDLQSRYPAVPNKQVRLGRRMKRALLVSAIVIGIAGAVPFYWYLKPAIVNIATLVPSVPATMTSVAPDAEVIPPIGKQQRLALGSVRYCRYQEQRLRIIKQHVNGAEDVRAYNMLASDYNSRCADFFFQDQDQKTVADEMEANKAAIEADAMRILATWPWHATAGNTAPAK